MSLVPPFVFPVLPGLGWPVVKTQNFQTRIRRSTSGRENRTNDYVDGALHPRPIWEFSLTHNFLRGPAGSMAPNSNAVSRGPYTGAGFQEMGTLHGFITNTRGPFYPFFYDDVTDDRTTGEALGVGNGSAVAFQLYRVLLDSSAPANSLVEPVTAPRVVSAIYANGVLVPSNAWSVDNGTGVVTFVSPPANGVVLTADFTYWFRCRFTDDATDFEEFMYLLETTGIKFVSAIGDVTPGPP